MGGKEDLEHLLKVSRQKQLGSFCPLIIGTCREFCVCYYKGQIYAHLDGKERVIEACCTNLLITGTIEIN